MSCFRFKIFTWCPLNCTELFAWQLFTLNTHPLIEKKREPITCHLPCCFKIKDGLYTLYSGWVVTDPLLSLRWPLHSYIVGHILHPFLFALPWIPFPMVLTRKICLTIRSFLNWRSFPLLSWSLHLIQG